MLFQVLQSCVVFQFCTLLHVNIKISFPGIFLNKAIQPNALHSFVSVMNCYVKCTKRIGHEY